MHKLGYMFPHDILGHAKDQQIQWLGAERCGGW